jgi:hypothetical protein
MAEHLVGERLVAVGALAHRVIAAAALVAFAADDGEGHHDAVADLELAVLRPDFDHFAHELVAKDVAVLHAGHEAIEEVQVGAADGAARDFDDRIARMLDRRVGYAVAADILLAMPAKRSHRASGSDARGHAKNGPTEGWPRTLSRPGTVLAENAAR